MKLKYDEKFILPDDDGNLILVTEIDLDFQVLQNKIIPMKGIRFEVDYETNEITNGGVVDIQTIFEIDGVYNKEGE